MDCLYALPMSTDPAGIRNCRVQIARLHLLMHFKEERHNWAYSMSSLSHSSNRQVRPISRSQGHSSDNDQYRFLANSIGIHDKMELSKFGETKTPRTTSSFYHLTKSGGHLQFTFVR